MWCSDIHINPTKCSVVMNTVPKYSGSPLFWEYMRRHSKVPFEGCAQDLQDLLSSVGPTWLSDNHSWLQFPTSGDPPILFGFLSPKAPDNALAPLLQLRLYIPSTHLPSKASPLWSISEIRPQDFFPELAKCQISDGFNSKPGIWPDFLENRPSFIQNVLQTSTNRVWVLTFLWNLKPHVFRMV